MFLDWLWKKEQPLYIYYKKRVPAYYGLCGLKHVVTCTSIPTGVDRQLLTDKSNLVLKRDGYAEFYRSTYLIKYFTFDTRGNMIGFVADDC